MKNKKLIMILQISISLIGIFISKQFPNEPFGTIILTTCIGVALILPTWLPLYNSVMGYDVIQPEIKPEEVKEKEYLVPIANVNEKGATLESIKGKTFDSEVQNFRIFPVLSDIDNLPQSMVMPVEVIEVLNSEFKIKSYTKPIYKSVVNNFLFSNNIKFNIHYEDKVSYKNYIKEISLFKDEIISKEKEIIENKDALSLPKTIIRKTEKEIQAIKILPKKPLTVSKKKPLTKKPTSKVKTKK